MLGCSTLMKSNKSVYQHKQLVTCAACQNTHVCTPPSPDVTAPGCWRGLSSVTLQFVVKLSLRVRR